MSRAIRQSPANPLGRDIGFGQALLGVYITTVIVLTIIRDTLGAPFLAQLASTPSALLHGAWWQLLTSGLVVDGPLLPQVAAVGVLGALGIYFRGSLIFWLTAALSHILGTIVTYVGVGIAWLVHPGWVEDLLEQPDYGISLIWCAAMGMVAAAAWLGPDSSRNMIFKPLIFTATLTILAAVTWFSVGLARYEHIAAFAIAFAIVMLTPQHRHIGRRLAGSPSKRR